MVIARAGQGATQSPQPVQVVASSTGCATLPRVGRKRIAPASHRSPQTRHSTRCRAKQLVPIAALRDHGGSVFGRDKAGVAQARTHSPQNVQPRCSKLIRG